jgi:mono/diheme cytochrome c family protein
MKHLLEGAAALTLLSATVLAAHAASAQDYPSGRFQEQTGEALFHGICQGCHMPEAQGAVGAGAYPRLAGDPRLASSMYPAMIILKGQRAMPSFGGSLSDDQVAAVVNYLRTHFGNRYADPMTPAQVKSLRGG